MNRFFPTKQVRNTPKLCIFELNGTLGSNPSPTLRISVRPSCGLTMAQDVTNPPESYPHLLVDLEPTHMWFLNRFKTDNNEREFRVLKYDALKESWNVVARHRWY